MLNAVENFGLQVGTGLALSLIDKNYCKTGDRAKLAQDATCNLLNSFMVPERRFVPEEKKRGHFFPTKDAVGVDAMAYPDGLMDWSVGNESYRAHMAFKHNLGSLGKNSGNRAASIAGDFVKFGSILQPNARTISIELSPILSGDRKEGWIRFQERGAIETSIHQPSDAFSDAIKDGIRFVSVRYSCKFMLDSELLKRGRKFSTDEIKNRYLEDEDSFKPIFSENFEDVIRSAVNWVGFLD